MGRDRKFRWRNNPEGFSMDDENARDMELMGDELEDESEANWRKMRHEREMMIIEQNLNADNTQGEILLLDQNSQTVSTSNSMFLTKRKITVVKSAASMDQEAKANSPFLISKYNNSITSRSSFLSRDENTLSKLANFTKSTGETANPNSFVTNRGNFVFASLSPVANKTAEEATVRNKRKSEPTKITNDNKKQKVYVHSKKKLILDQLNN